MRLSSLAPAASWAARPRRRRGFTLAEVLAALVFMAIVIPAAVQGLRIANQVGQVALRKQVAARIASSVLEGWRLGTPERRLSTQGTVQEGPYLYRYSIRTETWQAGTMNLLTVLVTFPVQGQDYEVRLSTLVDPTSS
jgi:prepilin-type N-terminal cleavage/methylation domain-containing protein